MTRRRFSEAVLLTLLCILAFECWRTPRIDPKIRIVRKYMGQDFLTYQISAPNPFQIERELSYEGKPHMPDRIVRVAAAERLRALAKGSLREISEAKPLPSSPTGENHELVITFTENGREQTAAVKGNIGAVLEFISSTRSLYELAEVISEGQAKGFRLIH